MLDVKNIYNRWNAIINLTYSKQTDMHEDNVTFSNQTMLKDAEFKERVLEFHAAFMLRGPHSKEVNIQEGYDLFEEQNLRMNKMKEIREAIVKDQKLFNLTVSK